VLGQEFPGLELTGVDIEPKQLEYARGHLERAGVEATLVQADALALPFEDESFEQGLGTTIPQGRYGLAEDVANAALYLASDLASYVNGAVLTVDGGWLAEKSFVAGDAAGSAFFRPNETAE